MRTLHASTAVSTDLRGRPAVAAVLRWDGDAKPPGEGPGPRTVVRRLRQNDPVPPAYRALLLALWEARRLGARALILSTDDAEVAAQITGTGPPHADAVGAYLQVRAMLNAFRSVALLWHTQAHGGDAALASAAAGAPGRAAQPACTDLPLWAGAV